MIPLSRYTFIPALLTVSCIFAQWSEIYVYETKEEVLSKHREYPRSHSQVHQDQVVYALVGRNGYFLDVAANDASKLSNTLMLERDLGWEGICVERNPKHWARLAQRKCKVAGVAVGSTTGELAHFRFDNQMGHEYGGITGDLYDNKGDKGNDVPVTLVAFGELLKRFHAPSEIDYLSLDIEGAEYQAMLGWPWEKYSIKVMTVERPIARLRNLLKENGMSYLRDHGTFGDQMWCRTSLFAQYNRTITEKTLSGEIVPGNHPGENMLQNLRRKDERMERLIAQMEAGGRIHHRHPLGKVHEG